MALTYNGTRPSVITYNGANVKTVTYNGVVVWGTASTAANAISTTGAAEGGYTLGTKVTYTSTNALWLKIPLPAYTTITSATVTINSSNWSHVTGAATYSCHLYASTAQEQNNKLGFTDDADGYLTPNGNYTKTLSTSAINTINSVKPSNVWYRFGISKKTDSMKTTLQINSITLTLNYTI